MDNIKLSKKDKYIEFFYILGLLIYTFSRSFKYSLIIDISGNITSILRLISFLLLIPSVIFQKYNKKEMSLLLIFYALSIICIIFGGDRNYILYPTILIGIKNKNIKKIIYGIFIITLLCVSIHLITYIINYIFENKEFFSMFHITGRYNEAGILEKNTIMFADNNMFGIRFVCCIMQYLYITNRNKNRYLKIVILFVISVILLLLTQSRTSFIMCILLVLYLILEHNKLFTNNLVLIRNVSILGSIISSGVLIFVPSWNNSFANRINGLLSGRPSIFNKVFNYIGINLLPNVDKFNNMSKIFGTYMLPDNSYISIFFKWGLLISLLMFIFTYVIINKRKNEEIVNYYIIILSIWFIIEFISMEVTMFIVPLIITNKFLG